MAAHAIARQVKDHEQDEQRDDDDPESLDPSRRSRGTATGPNGRWSVGRLAHALTPLAAEIVTRRLSIQSVDRKSNRRDTVGPYTTGMPALWTGTIEAHRRAVRDATLDATAALVLEHGLASVTMSRIAEETGIGRATLYKYFPDVEAILLAWHDRQVGAHLEQLTAIRDEASGAHERLTAVLEAYAFISHDAHGGDVAALLHRGDHVVQAEKQLHDLIRDLVIEGVSAGTLRDDVEPEVLASYCLHALTAASGLRSKAAVRRLVTVTVAGLRPPP